VNGKFEAIRPAILALVLLTIGNRLSAGQSAPGVTDKTIVIGSCSALEGPSHALGTQQIKGAQAYFELINDEGGIAGRKAEAGGV
jgi:ABC-type branched-subunit amino acid transport system substrate-binding protein